MADIFWEIGHWRILIDQVAWIVPALMRVLLERHSINREKVFEIFLLFNIGVGGFIMATNVIFHTLFADEIAQSIGWPAGNPFQTEVGFAGLAIGSIGFLGFWRKDFWLPFVIGKAIFGWGAGLTHIVDIVRSANFSPGNAGAVLYGDFLFPVVTIVLYVLYRSSQKINKQHGARTRLG